MLQAKQKNLVEVCPQCYKLIDTSANRLVHDTCGHLKCRICLLQETAGCLLCLAKNKASDQTENILSSPKSFDKDKNPELQQRKSVITSLAIQKAEQSENAKFFPSVHNDTCHLIKQSLKKDILFPTDIVKRSTGNFYHLKRVFSQRFFNENINKKNKACETEEKWSIKSENNKSIEKEENKNLEKNSWKMPRHIQVQYYCKVHKAIIQEKNNILKYHMTCNSLSDKNENPLYQCKICTKSYKVIGKLNRHMKIHTKNSKFKCGKCGKTCTDNYALKTHERTHTQQKPYSCQYCEKKFSGLQNFKRHEKKHRGEKKFVCDECGFKFITRAELKRHGVTHTNIKPFTCSECSTNFAFKRTLIRHLKIHDLNLSRIKCQHCDSTFKRKDNLERHVKTTHLDIKTEEKNVNV